MKRSVAILSAAVLLVLVNGVVHGLITHRWTAPVDHSKVARALSSLPLTIGPWRGTKLKIDPVVQRATEAAGVFQANFVNEQTGQGVTVLALSGEPGPMSVHMPEHCYAGLGYRQQGDVQRVTFNSDGRELPFRKVVMVRDTSEGVPEQITVYHGWNDGTGWSAPALPRLVFANARFLVKLYVTTPPVPVGADFDDPVPEFLPLICREIEQRIAPLASE